MSRWTIRRMKTKWGSCNRESRHIWLTSSSRRSIQTA
ncbi:hypothetical protein [Actinoplanes sp. NPDC049599]